MNVLVTFDQCNVSSISKNCFFCVHQMMNKVFGGTVHRKSVREDGVFNIALDNSCSLFRYISLCYVSWRVFVLSLDVSEEYLVSVKSCAENFVCFKGAAKGGTCSADTRRQCRQSSRRIQDCCAVWKHRCRWVGGPEVDFLDMPHILKRLF